MNFYSYRYALWHGGGRPTVAADAAINYTEHDKRYHHGNFDPKTMTCEMREAEAKGDLVDVLNAEQTEADYAKRKAKALKKANKEEAKAARSAEIEHKTIAELSSREYSDEDRRMVDEAIDYVLESPPVDVTMEEAVNMGKALRGQKRGEIYSNLIDYMSKQYPSGITVEGLGNVKVNRDSAHSIVAHAQPHGITIPKWGVISQLGELLGSSVLFAKT